MFYEVRGRNRILHFDEVDTFLDSRESVQQGHEKSMVNEVLQQMESFGGVFIGTTNFKDMLDHAVARRFTFGTMRWRGGHCSGLALTDVLLGEKSGVKDVR